MLFGEPYGEEACRGGDGTVQAPIAIGTTGDTVSVEAVFDGWGYVHLFRNGEGKLRELDTYAIPEAHDERFAEGFGDRSVHEVAMSEERNDLAYFSYYSGGFRVAKIRNGNLRGVGSYSLQRRSPPRRPHQPLRGTLRSALPQLAWTHSHLMRAEQLGSLLGS